MEKNNGKIVAVVALAIAVVALSVGFAAFSATLNIENATATVKANDEFSPEVNYTTGQTVSCVYTGTETPAANTNGGTAAAKTWTGVSAALTADHKSVTCTAQVYNESDYTAYLRKVSMGGEISCASVAAEGTDGFATNVAAICNTVRVTVNPGQTAVFTKTSHADVDLTGNNGSIASGAYGNVELTIEYTSTTAADGDISITIPTIGVQYKTA